MKCRKVLGGSWDDRESLEGREVKKCPWRAANEGAPLERSWNEDL